MSEPMYLTENELAERWKVSPATLRTRRSRRISVPYVKLHGVSIRYPLDVVKAWERAGRHER